MRFSNTVRPWDACFLGNGKTHVAQNLFKLTLSGTRKGTFTLISLIEQILSADFFFKNFQTLLEVKIENNWII